MRVSHGLERGEGLGGDDEYRLGGIEIAHCFGEIRAIDIGEEPEGHDAVAVVPQRFVCHDRPKIRSADADIDYVADALAGMTLPGTAAEAMSEIRHFVEDGMDLAHQVAPI